MKILSRQVYNPVGVQVQHEKNYSSNGLTSREYNARLADKYFRDMNSFPVSPGVLTAVVEIIGATALVRCFPTYAAKVNWLTTAGELGATLISQSDNLSKSVQDGLLAWFQVGSGIFGLGGFIKETFFKPDEEDFSDVSIINKIALSASSLLNVFAMATGAVEKSLLSMIARNTENTKRDGSKYRSSLTSALGDRRCCAEWGIMTIVPWVSNIDVVRKLLDFLIPYQAIREGCDTFVDEPDSILIFSKKWTQNNSFKKFLKFVVNPFSVFKTNQEPKKNKYNLCWPFKHLKKFLLGTESDVNGPGSAGFRNYCIGKLYSALGCKKIPFYYLDKNENIVAQF